MPHKLLLALAASTIFLCAGVASAQSPLPREVYYPGGDYYYPLPQGFHRLDEAHLPGFSEATAVARGTTSFTVAARVHDGPWSARLVARLYPGAHHAASPHLWDVPFAALTLKDGRPAYVWQVGPFLLTAVCHSSRPSCSHFALSVQTALA